MKKKLLALFLACAALVTAGCGSIGSDSPHWIDSSIKGNVTADTVVSLKDDFAAAANQDYYTSEDRNGRTIVNIARMVTDRKRALLTDDSVTGKGIEEVRKYAALAEDLAGRQTLGVTPLEPYIRSIEAITTAEELFAWIADADSNPLGASPVEVAGPGRSEVDPSSYYVMLGNSAFTLSRQNGASDAYFNMNESDLEKMVVVEGKVTCVLEKMGYTEDQIQSILDDTWQVEKTLAGIVDDSLTKEEEMTFTREEIAYIQGDFPMMEYLDQWGYGACNHFLADAKYLKAVDNVCSRYLEKMKSFLMVKYVLALGAYLDEDTARTFEQLEVPRGVTLEPDDRTEEQKADDKLFENQIGSTALVALLNEAYLDTYISPDVYDRLYGMTADLIDVYRDIFANEPWLSDEAKALCLEKLNALKIHVVFPDKGDYSDLSIVPAEEGGNFLEAALAVRKFGIRKSAALSAEKVDLNKWDPFTPMLSSTQTNSFYYPNMNGIYICAGILDDPVFTPEMSDEEMLAGIGTVVGHEITHGFDANGVQYDKDGVKQTWLPSGDQSAFGDRTIGVTSYYSGLTPFQGSGLYNGTRVQVEATADMGGMKAVLELASRKEQFDYDKFFRQFARVWSSQVSYDHERYMFEYDEHPLDYLRINVTLAQYDEFLNTYDIHEGDGMFIPEGKRVKVW
ncbi:MAG: M13 family metallopeptidase [Oscillospiraceae bacterium]|nr:M13 family metallopeptidase [Oscillospiraceae bacterium]